MVVVVVVVVVVIVVVVVVVLLVVRLFILWIQSMSLGFNWDFFGGFSSTSILLVCKEISLVFISVSMIVFGSLVEEDSIVVV